MYTAIAIISDMEKWYDIFIVTFLITSDFTIH